MTKAFRDKIITKAEELGWNCTVDDENDWEFYQMSPAGEDFGMCVCRRYSISCSQICG